MQPRCGMSQWLGMSTKCHCQHSLTKSRCGTQDEDRIGHSIHGSYKMSGCGSSGRVDYGQLFCCLTRINFRMGAEWVGQIFLDLKILIFHERVRMHGFLFLQERRILHFISLMRNQNTFQWWNYFFLFLKKIYHIKQLNARKHWKLK